ncbi:MAG: ECF-type sigma factor [Pyrinomonadaceae bacterium]
MSIGKIGNSFWICRDDDTANMLYKKTPDAITTFFQAQNLDLLALHEALERLAKIDERKSRLVELKFFGGLTTEEIARAAGKSAATIERDWSFARAWLKKELKK